MDPDHPVTSSNWPAAQDLDLHFLDFVSFNLYPGYPPEVVLRAYGAYITEVLQPIARGKPLLITEFGADSLEAGENGKAHFIEQSWDAIRQAGIAGGVVFEFADEWWKNYDIPAPNRPGIYWEDRVPAPNKGKVHDADPEEYYGIMTAYRQPRAAFYTVQQMFGGRTVQ